jgi:pimeloyl-ACP methyl ester carboxylesterase
MNHQRDVEERGRRFVGRDTREQLLAELPVKERRLDLAGISSAVLEGGEGPPMLLLHGPGEFAALWARVIPDLIGTHRVVAYSLEWARTKTAKAALRSLMPEYGMRPIPRDVLAGIEVPYGLDLGAS